MLVEIPASVMKQLEAAAQQHADAAGGKAELANNYLFWSLYGNDQGYYRDADDNRKSQWKNEKGSWVRFTRRLRRRQWIEDMVRIVDKNGEIVPLKLHQAQRDLYAKILRMERKKKPVRIVILKARQIGYSTFIQAFFVEMCMRNAVQRVLLVAQRNKTARTIFGKVHLLKSRMPRGDTRWRFEMSRASRDEIMFGPPSESVIEVDSAEVGEPGHGDTLRGLHMTETSRWDDARMVAKGILQTVPKRPRTYVLDETTAAGDSGYFRDKFVRAYYGVDRNTSQDEAAADFMGWEAHFSPWYVHQEYRYTKAFGCDTVPEKIVRAIREHPDEEEKALLQKRYLLRRTGYDANGKQIGGGWVYVDYDQLAWRRQTISTEFNGMLDDFHEQYPSTPEEAFLASGRPVFDGKKIKERMAAAKKPRWIGDIPIGDTSYNEQFKGRVAALLREL